MSEQPPTRPQRIATMREAMEELGRAGQSMRETLRASNDAHHQAFFGQVLDRLALIVANERQGLMRTLADDLANFRSAIRRLRLPDRDPDLGVPTPALRALRSERGNLIEAVDNALEAAAALRLHPRDTEVAGLYVEPRDVAIQLGRLDERLRIVQEAVADLDVVAKAADAAQHRDGQRDLVDFHVETMKVEVSAARFETGIGADPTASEAVDINALSRAVEAMADVAADLRQVVDGLSGRMTETVRSAGRVVVRAAERSRVGLRTVGTWSRRRFRRTERTERLRKPEQSSVAKAADWSDIAEPGSYVALGLEQIVQIEPGFEPRAFVEGAKRAYEAIVLAFAKGDRKTLRSLLSSEVAEGFEQAITDREKRNQTAVTTFVSIHKAEITRVEVKNRVAQVTVRFLSNLINATRDADGKVVDGHAESVVEVPDLWTFARNLGDRDPNWQLVATDA